MYELEGVLGPSVVSFVEDHVRSLLTWDILVFFQRNPDVALDLPALARRLGRKPEDLIPEVEALCGDGILCDKDGVIRFDPPPEKCEAVADFVEACQERRRRLVLIALVLHKVNPKAEN
ncbi:MAG: hypothetical protein Kow0056_12870 [Coriobacteriia bacterium]